MFDATKRKQYPILSPQKAKPLKVKAPDLGCIISSAFEKGQKSCLLPLFLPTAQLCQSDFGLAMLARHKDGRISPLGFHPTYLHGQACSSLVETRDPDMVAGRKQFQTDGKLVVAISSYLKLCCQQLPCDDLAKATSNIPKQTTWFPLRGAWVFFVDTTASKMTTAA